MNDKVKQTSNSSRSILEPAGVTNLYRNTSSGIFYLRAKINGHQKKVSLDTDSRSVALDLLPRKLAELRDLEAHGFKTNADLTIGQCLEQWHKIQTERHGDDALDDTTQTALLSHFNKLKAVWGPAFLNTQVRKLRKEDLSEKHKRLHAKYCASCVNTIKRIFVGAFQIAVDARVILANPATGLSCKSANAYGSKQIPTQKQLVDFLDYLTAPTTQLRNKQDIRDLVEFLCCFGSRIDETRRLRCRDVDLAANVVWFRDTKSGRDRDVPIFDAARPLVLRLLAGKAPEDRLHGVKACDRTFASAARALKQPRWTHHTFRHVFATRALNATKNFHLVAGWLGHQDGGTLLAKTYAHLDRDYSQAESAKVTWEFTPKPAPPVVAKQAAAAPDPAAEIAALKAELARLRAAQNNPVALAQAA